MTKITVNGRTVVTGGATTNDLCLDGIISSGQFAGVCYAPEGFETIKKQPLLRAIGRADSTAHRHHDSVFGHFMVNMEIECPKIICMILNSIGVSNTSEKSSRYTKMHPENESEQQKYQKWHDIIFDLIHKEYPGKFDNASVSKLAYENARYMISVFTSTFMEYSIPWRNIYYLVQWLTKASEHCKVLDGIFNQRLSDEMKQTADAFTKVMGGESNYIQDIKDEYLRFIPYQFGKTPEGFSISECNGNIYGKPYYGDTYTDVYKCSFACLAQEERHRTLSWKMIFLGDENHITDTDFYIPKIIRKNNKEGEWLTDLFSLRDIFPQGTLVEVVEQGTFENFVLKCKERMCNCAQLEIMNITYKQVLKFLSNKDNLSEFNKRILQQICCKSEPVQRCKYPGYKCVNPCQWGSTNNRLI